MWEIAVLVVVLVGGVAIYNGLVKLRERGESAWADIDVQLKRRHDLVPNLVETVEGYAGHERDTLQEVVAARRTAVAAQGPAEQGRAEDALQQSITALFAVAEDYPELRAAESFQELQATLVDLEDHIQRSRRYYNAVVRDYNTRIGQVPSNLVARTFGFREREFFGISGSEREVPEVRLDEEGGEGGRER